MVPMNRQMRLCTHYVTKTNRQNKIGKIDPHYQGETGLLLYSGGGTRNPGILYGLSTSMLNIKGSGKLQQPKKTEQLSTQNLQE